MNLAELGERIDAATDVFRVETLDAYASGSDYDWVAAYLRGDPPPDPGPKQWYLDGLRWRAENGHPQRRLRVIPRPVSDYIRYACEWGYTDNVAAGEDVRILDGEPALTEPLVAFGDFYILDGVVVAMRYRSGAFVGADVYDGSEPHGWVAAAWAHATPFTQWWTAHPELHRTVCA